MVLLDSAGLDKSFNLHLFGRKEMATLTVCIVQLDLLFALLSDKNNLGGCEWTASLLAFFSLSYVYRVCSLSKRPYTAFHKKTCLE